MSVLNIIKKNKEYRRIYSRGKSYADRYMVIYILENNSDISRFGFTVSKKIGKAVKRNRIRRILKEVCRLNLKNFPQGFDYIIIARHDIGSLSFLQIEERLLRLLKKASIIRRWAHAGFFNFINKVLPVYNFTYEEAYLSFLSYMFELCPGGGGKVWDF